MTSRRAFTLIEVDLAGSLLALIAATVVPLLRGASHDRDLEHGSTDSSTLSEAVDALLATPDQHGLEQDPRGWGGSSVQIDDLTIDISVHSPQSEDTFRAWVTFSNGQQAVHRVFPLPEEE